MGSLILVTIEAHFYQIPQVFRKTGRYLRNRVLSICYIENELHWIIEIYLRPRLSPSCHLQQSTPETPDIRPPPVLVVLDHLWGTPGDRPSYPFEAPRHERRFLEFYLFGASEISQFNIVAGVHQDIGAFKVVMRHSQVIMQVAESGE